MRERDLFTLIDSGMKCNLTQVNIFTNNNQQQLGNTLTNAFKVNSLGTEEKKFCGRAFDN